jgi:hypothetical protein
MNFLLNQNPARVRHYLDLLIDDLGHRLSRGPLDYEGRVLVNSFPKAGTHLLEGILRALPGLHCPMHRTIRTAERNRLRKLRAIRPGTFRTAHLQYGADAEQVLRETGIHHLLLLRNPQNVIVSQIRYLTEQHRGNPLARHFQSCATRAEQIRLVIEGNPAFPGLGERLGTYRRWLDHGPVLELRFEELLRALGAGDEAYFQSLLDHIGMQIAPDQLATALAKAKAQPGLTFSGKISSGWGEHYDARTRELYTELVLPEAELLGYPGVPWA